MLKAFTFFEHSTVCLLLVLRFCFGQLHVFKPCTSKEGNSEVYLIALDYLKKADTLAIVDRLRCIVFDADRPFQAASLFPLADIPATFLADVIACSVAFKTWQESAIMRNLMLYNLPSERKNLKTIQEAVAIRYIDLYQLGRINDEQQLTVQPRRKAPRSRSTIHSWPLERHQRIQYITAELEDLNSFLQTSASAYWTCPAKDLWTQAVSEVTGRPYQRLVSSKFCLPEVLLIFRELDSWTMAGSPMTSTLAFSTRTDVLRTFLSECASLKPGDRLQIKSGPILSRFAASTIWMISQLFAEVQGRRFKLDYFILVIYYLS